jgi:hypothetical protein
VPSTGNTSQSTITAADRNRCHRQAADGAEIRAIAASAVVRTDSPIQIALRPRGDNLPETSAAALLRWHGTLWANKVSVARLPRRSSTRRERRPRARRHLTKVLTLCNLTKKDTRRPRLVNTHCIVPCPVVVSVPSKLRLPTGKESGSYRSVATSGAFRRRSLFFLKFKLRGSTWHVTVSITSRHGQFDARRSRKRVERPMVRRGDGW